MHHKIHMNCINPQTGNVHYGLLIQSDIFHVT